MSVLPIVAVDSLGIGSPSGNDAGIGIVSGSESGIVTYRFPTSSNLQILQSLFASVDGFAIDFLNANKLWIDSGQLVQVSTTGDLVGYAQDDSGNGNHFIQATGANRHEWLSGQGIQALDSGDVLEATAATANDIFTLIARAKDSGVVSDIFSTRVNANNRARLTKTTTTNLRADNRVAGSTQGITIKDPVTASSINTLMYQMNAVTNDYAAQFNDETVITSTRINLTGGTLMQIGLNHTAPIERIIFLKDYSDADTIAVAKTLVEEGW